MQSLDRIYHQDANVRFVDGAPRAKRRVELDAFTDARLPAQPRRIDEDERSAVIAHRRVDRISRGAGLVRDDQPLLAEQTVDERRLADVGSADHGNPERVVRLGFIRWKALHHRIEQIAGAAAVDRRNWYRLPGVEIVELKMIGRARIVHLVGDQHPRAAGVAQHLDHPRIVGMEPGPRIDDQHEEVSFGNGHIDLAANLQIHWDPRIFGDAAGVDQPESPAVPLGACEVAVSSGTSLVADDRCVGADDSVEQCGLSDVGPPDQGDDRNVHLAIATWAPELDTPSPSRESTSMKS